MNIQKLFIDVLLDQIKLFEKKMRTQEDLRMLKSAPDKPHVRNRRSRKLLHGWNHGSDDYERKLVGCEESLQGFWRSYLDP